MYSYIPSQQQLFEDIFQQRLVQIQKGIKVQYRKPQIKIKSPKYYVKIDEECKRFNQMLQKKHCLGIYSLKGCLISKIQPFEFKRDEEVNFIFTIIPTSVQKILDQDCKKYGSKQYFITVYRNASDYAYRFVLSKKFAYFQGHTNYKSEQLLSYIKGERSQLKVDNLIHLELDRSLKNKEQLDAITKSGRLMTLIIQGPAGVGKSLVGCKIGVQFCIKQKKVIMVTVTNTGAKSICQHLVQELGKNKLDNHQQNSNFLRLIKAITKVKSQITSPNMQIVLINLLDRQIKQKIKKISQNPKKINFLYFNLLVTLEQYFCMQPYLRFYSFNTHIIMNLVKLTNYEMPLLDILLNLNKIANKVLVLDIFKELYIKAVRLTIASTNLVVTNTAKAAELNRYQLDQQRFNPYLAIFDEAGQSTLADTYCVLNLDITRIVLIGDQKQLPPTINGNYQSLKFTLFSIMKNKPQRNLVKFTYQYRMHPQIAQLVSYLTYGGEIKNGYKKNKRISKIKGYFQYPVFLVTHDEIQQMPTSMHQNGYFNIQQIKMIKMYIDQFPDQDLKNIGIVTVYKAQQRRMKEVFQTEIKLGLSISTVDGYQGAQKDYIFFSVVRSNYTGKLGFSQDKNRVNVALSRAKIGLMVVGNIDTLQHGNYDNPWKYVIHYLFTIDSVFHFPQELIETANQNYKMRKQRDKTKQIEVQQAFDVEQDIQAIQVNDNQPEITEKQVFFYQTEELPFIGSNYN